MPTGIELCCMATSRVTGLGAPRPLPEGNAVGSWQCCGAAIVDRALALASGFLGLAPGEVPSSRFARSRSLGPRASSRVPPLRRKHLIEFSCRCSGHTPVSSSPDLRPNTRQAIGHVRSRGATTRGVRARGTGPVRSEWVPAPLHRDAQHRHPHLRPRSSPL